MYRELARKQPAEVITARPRRERAVAGELIIEDRNRTVVAAQVGRMWRAGEIERGYRLGRIGDRWVAAVLPVPPRSWLRRNGLRLSLAAGGAVAFLGGLAWAVRALALAVAAALPLLAGAVGLVVCLVIGAMIIKATGGRSIEVIQKVKIKG
jgi:hypothetical protein